MSEAEIGTQMAIRSLTQVALMACYSQVIRKVKTLDVYKVGCIPDDTCAWLTLSAAVCNVALASGCPMFPVFELGRTHAARGN
jgi:hypothetical protein